MKKCLKIFEVIFCLNVNLAKSCLVGIHVDQVSIGNFARLIGCNVGRWPLKYLGMPLGVNPRLNSF